MKNRIIRGFSSFILSLAVVVSSLSGVCYGEENDIVLQADFENASLEGLATMGNVSLVVDNTKAYSGNHCLKVTNRTANWNGVAISNNNILQPGKSYKITAFVFHDQLSAEDIKCTLKTTDNNATDSYDNLAVVSVPSSTWTEISSEFTIPSDISSSTLYFEATHTSMDIYIDMLTLEMSENGAVDTPPASNPNIKTDPKVQMSYTAPTSMPHCILHSDFEAGTADNWTPVDVATLTLDYDHHASGEASLKASSRKANWDGPSKLLDDLIVASKTYHVAGYVYHESSTAETITMTMRWKNSNGTTTYNSVATASIAPGKWTLLEGDISTADDFNSPCLYVEASNAQLDFYIDNMHIYSDTPVAVSNNESFEHIPQEDEYKYSFESDLEDWNSRSDIRIVRTDEYAHSGNYSVYITDRDVYWSGLSRGINFIDQDISNTYSLYVFYTGNEYENSHLFQLNLQYDLDGSTYYENVATTEVEKNKWTKVSGDFVIPKGARNTYMYIQTGEVEEDTEDINDLMSFYVDDASIVKTSIAKKRHTIFVCIIVISSLCILTALTILVRKIVMNAVKTNRALMSAALDAMTQTLNRNTYEQKINILKDEPEMCKGMYIAVCDVNFLKFVNDNYGHEMGDEAITRCGALLLKAVGKKGLVYRTGGDEFVCMSQNSFEEQIKKEIEIETSKYNGYPFSVAVGFSHNESDETPDINDLITKADKAMYENKQLIKSQNAEFAVR